MQKYQCDKCLTIITKSLDYNFKCPDCHFPMRKIEYLTVANKVLNSSEEEHKCDCQEFNPLLCNCKCHIKEPMEECKWIDDNIYNCNCGKCFRSTNSPKEPMEWTKELRTRLESGRVLEYWEAVNFISSQIKQAEERAREEEHQFFKNILDGIDMADKEMESGGEPVYGGTKAIRFALSSRVINQNNE